MLLFISSNTSPLSSLPDFNTSHVTVYLSYCYPFNICNIISIHLMLLFIFKYMAMAGWDTKFQYISCYCLSFPVLFHQFYQDISIHLMLLFISGVPAFTIFLPKFQYISCYCLSLRPPNIPYTLNISIHLMLLFISAGVKGISNNSIFQYISCYCLSLLGSKNQICG